MLRHTVEKKYPKQKKECIVMSFQVVAGTAAKCTKMKNARSKRVKLLFLFSFLKMQICDVLVVTVLMFAHSNRLQIYRFICRHMKQEARANKQRYTKNAPWPMNTYLLSAVFHFLIPGTKSCEFSLDGCEFLWVSSAMQNPRGQLYPVKAKELQCRHGNTRLMT